MNTWTRGGLPLALAAALGSAACSRANDPPVASFEADGLRVEVSTPSGPIREGQNELRFRVRDRLGASVDDARVSVQYAMSMAGMPSMGGQVTAEAMGDGEYRAEPTLAMAGTWQVSLAAERPTGEAARAEGILRTGAVGLRLEAATSSPAGEAISHYTCPMHPSVREARAGNCPLCGMGLVPVTSGEAKSGAVRVDPQRLQRLGVRFVEVQRALLVRKVRALGRVTWNEAGLVDVSLKVGGFVRGLRADSLGLRVSHGETLFSVYSPELYAAQAEYLQAQHSKNEPLRRAARARLRLWDVADRDVAALEERGAPFETLPVRSPASGALIEKNVVEGAAFEPGMRLFRIAPLDKLWIEAEVYVSDLPLVSPGQRATVSAPYLPGSALEARVAYVLPSLAIATRTARVRLELETGALALRPEMFVDVELHMELGDRLIVPEAAIIVAGKRRVVFVDRGAGLLEPRSVRTGTAGEAGVEILEGLEAGERVVASGNFLIAAESRIQSALEQW